MLVNLGEEKDANFYSSVEYMHPSHILCGCVAVDTKNKGGQRRTHSSGGGEGLQKRVPGVKCLLEAGDTRVRRKC